MLQKIYGVIGVGILAFYAVAGFSGWELGTQARETVPADVRNSPGGYRSYHFWHSGFRGGK